MVETRNLCPYFSVKNGLSCTYHDSCVEGIFQCSSMGFHIGYSKPRCEAVKQFRQSSEPCSKCFKHQEFVDWAIATEECFQPQLQQLATKWSTKATHLEAPDSQTCVEYETEALNELNSCYQEKISPVCDLLSNELNQDFVADLETLVSALTISDYYKPVVRNHLRALIEACGADSAVATANEAIPKPIEKVMFCAGCAGCEDDVLSLVHNHLDRSMDEFIYADSGPDSITRDSFCQARSDKDGSGSQLTGYRLIQWTPHPSDDLPSKLKKFYKEQISATASLFFYNYTNLTSSCGNGIREAGELCDTFGELGNEDYGCNQECRPFAKFECSTDQLTLSSCAKSTCGDGQRSSLEECDDGNDKDEDGCSNNCKIEPDFECTELSYNTTSYCKQMKQAESSAILLPVITPTSATTQSSTHSASSSVAMETTTTRTVVVPTVLFTDEPDKLYHSSAHSVLRTSSVSWLTIFLLLSAYLLLFR